MLVVAALGVVRVMAGYANGRPVVFLIIAVVLVFVAGLLLVAMAPRRTRAGDALLRRLAADHHLLSPSMRPDWEVYGPAGAALAVGVFGVGALWAADPAFATELAAQRAASAGYVGRWQLGGGDSGGVVAPVGEGAVVAAAAEAAVAERGTARRAAPRWGDRHRLAPGDRRGGRRPSRTAVLRGDRRIAAGGGRAPVALPRGVAELRGRGVAVVPHGVRLSLGGAEPLDPVRVTHLAACAAALDAPLVSEHVAFVRAGGREAGHLLPLPRSRAALDVLSAHVRSVQAELDVPLALEPIAALFDWPDDEYTEGEFLTALLERTGAMLLLDVANVYANAVNRGTDPEALFDAIPLERVAYVHVAGGAEHAADPGVYHDTHTDPVPPAVLALLERLRERLDVAPAVMLERDGRYPPAATLRAELDAIAAAAALPSRRLAPAQPRFPVLAASTSACTTRPISPPGRPSWSRPWSPGRPTPPASTPTGSPSPGGPCVRKRAGEVAAVWPLLAASLGPRWHDTVAAHVAGRAPAGALRDGWDLARDLGRRGGLSDAAAVELAEREVTLHHDGRPRRLPAVRRCPGGAVVQIGGRVHHLLRR